MRSAFLFTLVVVFMASISGCGTPVPSAANTQPTAGSPEPLTTAQSSPKATQQDLAATAQTETTMDQIAIESLVKQDLAAFLNAPADLIRTVSVEARTWPDEGLGCRARRGVYEPVPVPGFLVQLAHNDRTFNYHTDQAGRFIRCLDPGKPLDPISR